MEFEREIRAFLKATGHTIVLMIFYIGDRSGKDISKKDIEKIPRCKAADFKISYALRTHLKNFHFRKNPKTAFHFVR